MLLLPAPSVTVMTKLFSPSAVSSAAHAGFCVSSVKLQCSFAASRSAVPVGDAGGKGVFGSVVNIQVTDATATSSVTSPCTSTAPWMYAPFWTPSRGTMLM